MFEETKELVKNSIKGKRKGSDLPVYIHSIRVCELLAKFGFSEKVQLAGLLHDMIEDSDHTFESLAKLGYSDEVLKLVDLCSYDASNPDKFDRWVQMIKRLVKEENLDAWAIKLADITDNLTECLKMEKDKSERFLFKKTPVFIYYGNKYFGGTEFYNHFLEVYYKQIQDYYEMYI